MLSISKSNGFNQSILSICVGNFLVTFANWRVKKKIPENVICIWWYQCVVKHNSYIKKTVQINSIDTSTCHERVFGNFPWRWALLVWLNVCALCKLLCMFMYTVVFENEYQNIENSQWMHDMNASRTRTNFYLVYN